MNKTNLQKTFEHLSQHSIDSVQTGVRFSDWDEYIHVDRPIENRLMEQMDEVDKIGGGIILLVGSAGDGKSHLISRIKQMSDWADKCFYNDATASYSPRRTAIDTLKSALTPFNDQNIKTTSNKLVLAINLGKLNAFLEDDEVKESYTEIVHSASFIFDDEETNSFTTPNRKIKVIQFSDEQSFELYTSLNQEYPVEAKFFSSILEKIVYKSSANPFYQAYLQDKASYKNNPLTLNFEILSIPAVRKTICLTIIEAIIQSKLNITPREFLDFVYSIMVYPFFAEYEERNNFYDALLPTLFYNGSSNTIQKAISKLDPLKHSSTEHDNLLSVLFTSYSIPKSFLNNEELGYLPDELISRTNTFYANNGRDIEGTTKFLFRLKHLLSYHSESAVYISYLSLLKGILSKDTLKMQEIYDMVNKSIPRHYGSYFNKDNMIPLNIQGGRYRLFAQLQLKPDMIATNYSELRPSHFRLEFIMKWKFPNDFINLRMDYQLFSYLYELNRGRLALSYENEKDLTFNRFVRQLIEKCDCSEEITIVRSDSAELRLTETSFGNIQLQ